MKSQNLSLASPLTPSLPFLPYNFPPPRHYLNVSISIGLINTSFFRCLCLSSVLACCGREDGWWIGMESGLLVFWFGFNIISESFSFSVCLWSIIIYLLSLILSLRFPLIHHCWVCLRQRLWIMQWPFHWRSPAWPSLDTTGLNSIHHNNILPITGW